MKPAGSEFDAEDVAGALEERREFASHHAPDPAAHATPERHVHARMWQRFGTVGWHPSEVPTNDPEVFNEWIEIRRGVVSRVLNPRGIRSGGIQYAAWRGGLGTCHCDGVAF
jgi:hypothetical protein